MTNSIFSVDERGVIEEEEMDKYTVGIILGFLGAGLNFPAQANQVLESVPLAASRLIRQTPVILEYSLAGPATVESEPIVVSGIIKTISVSAEFIGQVYLEASANEGAAYAKIINGQPLVEGFIPGNQLRIRANIAQDSILKKLIISYTDSSGVERLYRNPDLASYKYHQEINITGGSQEVFNYPLKVELGSRLLILGSGDPVTNDIYFTAADGQTPLYYYLEDKINCYVKVPQIPKEGTKIHVYYNGVIASPAGGAYLPAGRKQFRYNDPGKVFLFFDDFNNVVLNEEKWEIIPGLKKEDSLKDGYLQLKDCLVITRDFRIKQAILEFKAKAEESAGIQVVLRSKISAPGLAPYERIVYSSNYPGAEHTIAINNIVKLNIAKPIQSFTDYIYRATVNSTGILFERYSEDQQEKQVEIKFWDVENPSEGYIGLKADASVFGAGSVYFDWIRVRPYVEVEPQVVISAKTGE
jgi:hypothetical protein